jgi:N-acylneuraminate cytidylyltransferase
MGISMLRDAGVVIAVLSTEENAVVAARCAKLRIPFLQGVTDKRAALEQWVDDHALDLADTAYVGNDVNDLGCMQIVGLAIAVGDAHPEVLARAHITLSRSGGDGAVREACDMLLSFEP